MELSQLAGLGPARVRALEEAGMHTVEDLAGLDLRRNVEVRGVTQDALKGLKQRARQALHADGKTVPKAPYTRGGKATTPKATKPAPKEDPVVAFGEKRGFLQRILTRRS